MNSTINKQGTVPLSQPLIPVENSFYGKSINFTRTAAPTMDDDDAEIRITFIGSRRIEEVEEDDKEDEEDEGGDWFKQLRRRRRRRRKFTCSCDRWDKC